MNNSNNVINLEEYKKQRVEDRKDVYKALSVIPLKAFQPNQYYINPDKGAMIHVLFITDKSDNFNNQMIYVMEDPTGQFYCTKVEETTCKGWHDLHADVFRYEVKKNNTEPPKAS